MKKLSMTVDDAINDLLGQFAGRDRELVERVQERLRDESFEPLVEVAADRLSLAEEARDRAVRSAAEAAPTVSDTEARLIAETIVRPLLRPVLKILDNTLVMEFFGPDIDVWRERLGTAKTHLDAVIPAVGRIEVTNHPGFKWVGTGWLIADDVVVTNRHVARQFARRDNKRFVFRMGLSGPITCRIDFLEEFDHSRALEFSATEVLWIAPSSEADIAFLRVARNSNGAPLPRPVPLSARKTTEDQFVATIGYPARDDEFPDQALARRVFGEVYDKKRLAPGQVLESPDNEVLHDCSTLGGNSGSVVIDLDSGEAVALHYAGLFPHANYAVPAEVVKDRLRRVLRGEFAPVISGATPADKPAEPKEVPAPPPPAVEATAASAKFVIPLEITINFGAITVQVGNTTVSPSAASGQPTPPATANTFDSTLKTARTELSGHPNVLEVRPGYRFKDNWITDERVIVVEVKEIEARPGRSDQSPIPEQFDGVGVEVRAAMLTEQIRTEGIAAPLAEERVAKGTYRRPTHLRLSEVKNEPMTALFHVSPDSAFPNLRDFFSRTERRITATMYEYDAPHVLKALLDAVRPDGRTLTMVTQKNDGTEELVNDLSVLDERFKHAWASVGNAISNDTELLFPKAYHIKVAVRDGKEVWLSSGNWKDSGQPNIDPAGNDQTSWGPLNKNNREWHAIIENENLARQFEEYIKYDFSEAHRVPLPEAVPTVWPDVFIPEAAFAEKQPEIPARYFDALSVTRPLRIQPLLSPDNYIEHVAGLIEDAESTIYVQNQSFALLKLDDDGGPGDNEQEFYDLLALLRDRQKDCDVKIIFRDVREFRRPADWERQKKLLERMKEFGFDMDNNVKILTGCHTKGVIVDSDKVLLGSHNWTNQGALFNRDASLIVYDAEVARYFESIFLFDWEHRARQHVEGELPRGARLARPGEETPAGMRRVSLTDALYDLIE